MISSEIFHGKTVNWMVDARTGLKKNSLQNPVRNRARTGVRGLFRSISWFSLVPMRISGPWQTQEGTGYRYHSKNERKSSKNDRERLFCGRKRWFSRFSRVFRENVSGEIRKLISPAARYKFTYKGHFEGVRSHGTHKKLIFRVRVSQGSIANTTK